MKFSSISLIAAAVAGIAAPCPLYARTHEQVNSFRRDLDIYPRESGVAVLVDDLFTRAVAKGHQVSHYQVARHADEAIEVNNSAADWAIHAAAAVGQHDPVQKDLWRKVSDGRRQKANDFVLMRNLHDHLATLPRETEFHATATVDKKTVMNSIVSAEVIIAAAQSVIQNAQPAQPVRKRKLEAMNL